MFKKFFGVILGMIMGATLFAPVFTIGADGPPISYFQYISSDEINIIEPIFLAGRWRLPVDANISSVNVPNGRDPIPDAYFTVLDTGAEGDTITVTVKGTANDPSTPDDDVPQCSKVFTTLLAEVGDESALAARIISEIRADSTWKNTCFLKAQKVKDRKIVHIFSSKFSLVAEFYERGNAGDFDVTTTGTADVFEPHNTLVSRTKETSLAQDPSNPHSLGILGISGSVQVTAGAISDLYILNAMNGGSVDMQVDGSVTPVDFTIDCDADDDIFIEELRFYGGGNGIKFNSFLSQAGSGGLTNGIKITILSDEQSTILPLIKTTEDFKNKFAFGSGSNFRFDDVAGTDQFLAVFIFDNPFPIRQCGTFPANDSVTITIQDDLSSGLAQLELISFGFTKEP